MKTIASVAMTAIEAGEAIVTGAVEILPNAAPSVIVYSDVSTIDLDAITNSAATYAGGISVGVNVTGFDPEDVVRLTLPSGETYVAYSPWGDPSPADAENHTGSITRFSVVPDDVAANGYEVWNGGVFDGYEAARAAFGMATITGASAYRFFIMDDPASDNSGGLSIKIERGVWTAAYSDPDAIRVWGGYGPIEIDGETYQGVGDKGLAQQTAGVVGGVAQGLSLTLSGIEPHALALLEAEEIKGASAVIRRLIFASDGKTLLDAHVFDRGRIDAIDTVETIGGPAAIKLSVETAARGLGNAGARQRSDSDQRLINFNDGYFRNTAYAGEKMLYWGGKTPARAGSVLHIGSAGSGG